MLRELILKNRSYRRFFQEHKIDINTLKYLVELARNVSSASNLQPLRYIISSNPNTNDLIFSHLAWAGYLKDWQGPEDGERPSAYVIILGDRKTSNYLELDTGIAAQSIMLGAAEKSLGGCMVASIKRKSLRKELSIPENFDIILVLALGKPKEEVLLEEVKDADIKYYRDEKGIHHVPKRKLEEIIIHEYV